VTESAIVLPAPIPSSRSWAGHHVVAYEISDVVLNGAHVHFFVQL
jgi:hypothetical protein